MPSPGLKEYILACAAAYAVVAVVAYAQIVIRAAGEFGVSRHDTDIIRRAGAGESFAAHITRHLDCEISGVGFDGAVSAERAGVQSVTSLQSISCVSLNVKPSQLLPALT